MNTCCRLGSGVGGGGGGVNVKTCSIQRGE